MPATQRERALEQLVEAIVNSARPLRVVLFGSTARGEAEADSDFDLLVIVPDGTHRRFTAQRLYREIKGIGVPFDLVVATPSDLELHGDSPALIYRAALREGKELYAA